MLKEKSLKKNVIMGILNTIINILFPLILFIYVSRVLEPEGIGRIQLATSVSTTFELFASLGIPLYAVRYISVLRESKEEQNRNAIEIFWVNIINAVIIFCIYLVFIWVVYGSGTSFYIFLLYGVTIFSNAIGVEWYFKANEEFSYITLRNFIVKIISFVLTFIFIRKPADIIYYAIISICGIVGYSMINFIKFAKNTNLKFVKINYLKHLKPALSVFLLSFATTIYCSLDTIMLGYIKNESSVGIYTAAYRVTTTIITITTAINTIMLPRLSYYYEKNENDKIKRILNTSYQLTLLISLPACVGVEIFAEEIIYILSGTQFLGAASTLRIMAPIIIFVSLTNLIGIQIFYSAGHIEKTVISVFVGAAINLIANSILIPMMSYNGAAIGTLIAEFSVLVFQVLIGKELVIFKKFDINIVKLLLSTSIMSGVLLLVKDLINIHYILDMGLYIIIAIIIYFVCLLIMKEGCIKDGIVGIKNKLRGRKNEDV